MRVVDGSYELVTSIPYQRARSGGGREAAHLEVGRLRIDTLPDGCDAVIATGDLQGIAPSPWGGDPVLLGIALADHLVIWSEQGTLPPLERVGVILTGDLYSAPQADKRGATGDVTDVWLAFAAAGCSPIVGVGGNHDIVTSGDVEAMMPAAALLDGTGVERGGMRFAGIGGVIGDPRRHGRTAEPDYFRLLEKALAGEPDVLLLHEGPTGAERGQPGNPAIRRSLEDRAPHLTLCGHVHWDQPVSTLGQGHVVNVDDRVIILAAE